jgi:hypothetical protein
VVLYADVSCTVLFPARFDQQSFPNRFLQIAVYKLKIRSYMVYDGLSIVHGTIIAVDVGKSVFTGMLDNGKPLERVGRKAPGLNLLWKTW